MTKTVEVTEKTKIGLTAYSFISAAISLVIATAFFLGIYYKIDGRLTATENDNKSKNEKIEKLTKAINANNKAQKKLIIFLSVKFGVVLDNLSSDTDTDAEN